MKIAIVSDLHFHKFSQFSKTLESGRNSRLQAQLNEIVRVARHLYDSGGGSIVIGGDIFHSRGSISPEVLNPVLQAFESVVNSGVDVYAIAGNHDLESNDARNLSNAAAALGNVGVRMVDERPTLFNIHGEYFLLIPWMSSAKELRDYLLSYHSAQPRSETNVVIHAPVNGVIAGLPDHGLSAQELGDMGFKRVFAGHYHQHKDFGNGVWSIGSLYHQTWSDTDSLAGFLVLDEDGAVTHHESSLPRFVDLDHLDLSEDDQLDYALDLGRGNYVRMSLEIEEDADVRRVRELFEDRGALGVLIRPIKKATSARVATAKKQASLRDSIIEYVDGKGYDDGDDLKALCVDILGEVENG